HRHHPRGQRRRPQELLGRGADQRHPPVLGPHRAIMQRRTRISILTGLGALGVGFAGWATVADDGPAPVADLQCVRKMALDLTHRGPTADEVSRVTSGQVSLDELADEYLASAEFS